MLQKMLEHRPSEVCISAITVAQLRYGATRRKSGRLHTLIDKFVSEVATVPIDEAGATQFGRISAQLAKAGSPIGDFDTLIAAHAVSLGLTLVTNNVKHFGRVRGLKVQNWL